jgi:hypothetical protein
LGLGIQRKETFGTVYTEKITGRTFKEDKRRRRIKAKKFLTNSNINKKNKSIQEQYTVS